jgi:flagellar hook-associated protein 2
MSNNVSISGAISGIDTASLVNQLMSVESQSQTTIKTRQTAAQKAADTYTTLITSLKSLATQSAAIAKTSAWQGSSVTSSSTGVTATTTGNSTGTLTFDVTKVAAAHTLISDNTVASTASSVVTGGGDLTVYDANNVAKGTIDVGNGSLAEVVAGINASSLGLRAAAVQTAPGSYRLQVTSTTSGTASAFTLDGLTAFGTNVLTTGQDAELSIGKTNPYTVTSSSNTFANVLPGVSFTVSKEENGVTIDAKLDGSAIATQISSMVDATNAALTSLSASTAYDFTKNTGAALYGDNGIRGLQQQILSAVGGANAPGIQLTRDGKLSFDKDAFVKAFQANPAATANAFGATSSFTPNTGVLGKAAMILSNNSTRAGTYEVSVSTTAKNEVRSTPIAGLTGNVVLTQGSLTANYTVDPLDSTAVTVSKINSAAAAAGVATTATINGADIVFTANSAGTASSFGLTVNGAASTLVTAGRDIVGTIDGEGATGVGDILTLNSATSRANGISLAVDASDADAALFSGYLGDVTFKPGLAQTLSTLLNDVTDPTTGSLARAQQGRVDDVKDFQAQIDAWDIRLAARRATLTRQFTAMETALAALKSSSSAITNLLATSSSNSSN